MKSPTAPRRIHTALADAPSRAGILPLVALLLLLGGLGLAFGSAEDSTEATASHSTFHYELTRTLARAAGFAPEEAELIAVFDQAVDSGGFQGAGADGPLVQLTGTSRNDPETAAFFHFPRRGPLDADGRAHPGGRDTCSAFDRGEDPCGRLAEVQALELWAIDGGFLRARNLALPTAAVNDGPAKILAPGSLGALGIYLHSLADSYSHEPCTEAALRTYRRNPAVCGFAWYQEEEFGTKAAGIAFTVEAGVAVWQALQRYAAVNGAASAALWSDAEAQAFIEVFAALADSCARRALALEALAELRA